MAATAAAAAADAAADAAGTGDPLLFAGGCDDSACSTPFVSAPSSPSRDRDSYHHHAACFYSAPASPTRGGGGKEFPGGGGVLDFDFDFSSRFPSPSAAAMSSADELFCNGQIRPVRLAAALLQPHADRPLDASAEEGGIGEGGGLDAVPDERGRVRGRSVRRKARSMSPFRTHWRRSPAPAPQTPPPAEAAESADEPVEAVIPAASRSSSSSSSSTASSASSASSSSSRGGSRRWGGFLKDLLHRSKSDGGKTQHSHLQTGPAATPTSPSPAAAPKRSPSPSPSPRAARSTGGTGHHRGGRWRSAHERLYEARRAEAEEMRRRTNLPYRQGFLLFGCIGLGNRSSYGAVHGLARGLNAAAAVSSRS